MTSLTLTLLVVILAAAGTPPRNARSPSHPGDSAADTSPSSPASEAEAAERVRTLLGSIDTPVPAARWRAIGPAAVPPLAAVARDPKQLPSRRAKAVDGLAAVGGARAREIVLEVARSDEEPYGVRASALRGAARLLPPADLARQLVPIMESAPDARTRAAAAEVLARHASVSCAAVRARAEREDPAARAQFTRALERCRAATGSR